MVIFPFGCKISIDHNTVDYDMQCKFAVQKENTLLNTHVAYIAVFVQQKSTFKIWLHSYSIMQCVPNIGSFNFITAQKEVCKKEEEYIGLFYTSQ